MTAKLVLTVTTQDDFFQPVLDFCELYFENRKMHPSIVLANNFAEVDFQASPKWVDDMLERPKIHDDDYLVLKYLKSNNSLILDVGANWGYSAGAFIKLGIKAKIVSFEVIPVYKRPLDRMKEHFPDQYHFFITGLGAKETSLRFVTPVIDGKTDGALCTALEFPSVKNLAHNIVNFVRNWCPNKERHEISFFEFDALISTLDSYIPLRLPKGFNLPIEAIKIDVEGLEASVLTGGQEILRKQRPLILAEGANRPKDMKDLMDELGYLCADREGEQLVLCDGIGRFSNGFFVHKDRLEYYKSLGVLKA